MDTIYAEGQGMIAQADEVFELKFRENLDGIVAYMQGRNYSLQFRSTINLSGSYTILRTIAQEPQLGFYCLVGNQALQQYLSSLNIPSVLQPGNTLYVVDGYLVSRISHVNTRVFLPNGDVILADATPRKAQPGEGVSVLSLDWLETYTPPPPEQGEKSEHHEATVSPLELLLLASASLGLASTAWGYQYWHTWRRQRGQRLSRIERQLSQDPGEAQQELQALRHALVYFWDAGPQIKPEEQAQSPSFYTRLAQDMISFLTQENNATTNLPPTVVSILALSDPWQKLVATPQDETEDMLYLLDEEPLQPDHLRLLRRALWHVYQAKKEEPAVSHPKLLAKKIRHVNAVLRDFEKEIRQLQKRVVGPEFR